MGFMEFIEFVGFSEQEARDIKYSSLPDLAPCSSRIGLSTQGKGEHNRQRSHTVF